MVAARLPFASLCSLAFGWLGQFARVSSLRCHSELAPLMLRARNATCISQFVSSPAALSALFPSGIVAYSCCSTAARP